jgi:hypothetical protein
MLMTAPELLIHPVDRCQQVGGPPLARVCRELYTVWFNLRRSKRAEGGKGRPSAAALRLRQGGPATHESTTLPDSHSASRSPELPWTARMAS